MPPELEQSLRNNVLDRLANDEVAISMVVRLVQSIEIATIAKAAGFDAFYVDLEHCAFSLETTSQICIAALGAGITPLVRVPNFEPEFVSRVLDGGALGIIAPHVSSASDARLVVQNAKFAPSGNRSVTVGLPHFRFQTWPLVEARRTLNAATMVVAMIETEQGLAKADEIAAVDGVDILMIGTNDLCAEMGIDGQFDHRKVRDAYARVIEATRRHGKFTGIGGLASNPVLIEQFVRLGARFVSSGADLAFLLSAAQSRAAKLRELQTSR
ncbi:aldolase/citrate lyase family protein [Bradyrhizobium sp. LHD-71]|uniref:HpcH/HpaI aldolase family protein n=1 Tax=Bradyrhizobium sp. LHD-71 TaxID=3072141 RepID=UPI00280CFB6D|nr:aldolase/citrate lyase family protein [Bradyrhizobium sp. LHD-71]MDQ8731975.1 aldolase/citrate lyase family protein [Bradyrhizobium sp. LHD-71]